MIALIGDADVCDIWPLGWELMPVEDPCQVSKYFHCLASLLPSYSVKGLYNEKGKTNIYR